MTYPTKWREPMRVGHWPRALQWLLLVIVSLVLRAVFHLAGVPAASLLGPMIAAIVAGGGAGATVRVGRFSLQGSQAILGCLIGSTITIASLTILVHEWPVFLAAVLLIVGASTVQGWFIYRRGLLPKATAIWGTVPGAAPAMVLLSEASGADSQLVAFMQYLRSILIALCAAGAVRALGHGGPVAAVAHDLASPNWLMVAASFGAAGIGMMLSNVLKVPGGAIFLPMTVAGAAQALSGFHVELPTALVGLAYAAIGWHIGFAFNRKIFAYARILPHIILSILIMIGVCACVGYALARVLDLSTLTAILATAPGGIDTVSIIAASGGVELSLVMAVQALRAVLVVLLSPAFIKYSASAERAAKSS